MRGRFRRKVGEIARRMMRVGVAKAVREDLSTPRAGRLARPARNAPCGAADEPRSVLNSGANRRHISRGVGA
jgi:hypothetical protein